VKTIIIIFIAFFAWTLWDFLVIGRQEARRRVKNDKKFKVRSEEK